MSLDRLDVPVNDNHGGSQFALSKYFRNPKTSQSGHQAERIIFLHRDPRDTAVSCFSKELTDE